jgi:hypothetical protein
MSRHKRNEPTTRPLGATPLDSSSLPVTGRFVGVGKSSHLLYEAFEVTLKDGVVVEVKPLSRAPDLAANAVGACAHEIWQALRLQSVKSLSGGSSE